ncbi:MAG: hypothetical protein ACRC8S_07960 [Fimbriiglobus sp.]
MPEHTPPARQDDEDDGLVSHTETQSPEQVRAYWESLSAEEIKPVEIRRVVPVEKQTPDDAG